MELLTFFLVLYLPVTIIAFISVIYGFRLSTNINKRIFKAIIFIFIASLIAVILENVYMGKIALDEEGAFRLLPLEFSFIVFIVLLPLNFLLVYLGIFIKNIKHSLIR